MDRIQVFQDMVLTGPVQNRDDFVSALVQEARTPWRYDPKVSRDVSDHGLGSGAVLVFVHDGDLEVQAARLVLWPEDDGYHVPNVVPTAVRELTVVQYNALISSFAEIVARPAARRFGWTVGVTSGSQGLEDWLPSGPAAALRSFSGAANKSSGSSHPADERRWFDFIIASHRSGADLGADRLARWLVDVEGWSAEVAFGLAGEYERCVALLRRNDETPRE